MDTEYFTTKKEKAKKLYEAQKYIRNPYLKSEVIFNADGFHHLQFSARRERLKKEQSLKFDLLPLAIEIIKNAGTLQEYRNELVTIGKKRKDGFSKTKRVEYWGFIGIVGINRIKVKTVLRRIGDGNITFWSVMPFIKLKDGRRLYSHGIQDD